MNPWNGRLLRVMASAMTLVMTQVHAGDFSWNRDSVSPAINYAGRQVVATYAPSAPLGSRVTAVHASRSYQGTSIVQTSLCFGTTGQCVPMQGGQIMTHVFDGLDATEPVHMVHEVVGKGPLPVPVFVKGSVAVWFSPPALPGR